MNKAEKYDVFISYSRRDYVDENKVVIPNNIVSQIKDALKKAGISYWFDEDGLYSGDAWAEKLAERIEECSIFLFISTSNSNKSEWTSKEVATAHMFKKKIIPFRVDESVYNKSVIIYIANLDFIDYFTNPTLALTRLVDSISKYIKDKKEADEKLLAKKRKEEDEAKRLANAEQNALIEEVETACSDIEEYELKSVHTRKKATSKVKKIKSAEQRTRLANLIQSSGQLYVENQNLKEEKSKLSEENTALQEEVNAKTEKFKTLYIGYKSLEGEKNNLAKVISGLRGSLDSEKRINAKTSRSLEYANAEIRASQFKYQNEIKERCIKHQKEVEGLNSINEKRRKKIKIFLILNILLAIFSIVLICMYNDEKRVRRYYFGKYSTQKIVIAEQRDTIAEQRNMLNNFSAITPLIITDVKIETDYGDIGDDIYESNTMHLGLQIEYIGFKDKTEVKLDVKLLKQYHSKSGISLYIDDNEFSYKSIISEGDNILQYKESEMNPLKAGTYKIQIWYKDIRLISREFTIKAKPKGYDKQESKIGGL